MGSISATAHEHGHESHSVRESPPPPTRLPRALRPCFQLGYGVVHLPRPEIARAAHARLARPHAINPLLDPSSQLVADSPANLARPWSAPGSLGPRWCLASLEVGVAHALDLVVVVVAADLGVLHLERAHQVGEEFVVALVDCPGRNLRS